MIASVQPNHFDRGKPFWPLVVNYIVQFHGFIELASRNLIERFKGLNEEQNRGMKSRVYIINTARGALIDEVALVEALREGKVAGAALDVFEDEPLALDSPLRQLDNCIFGTHNSSNTTEAVMRVGELAIRNLLDGLGSAAP